MNGRSWTPRDWRQFVALTLLALGNIPLTGMLGWCLAILDRQPGSAGVMTLGIGIVALIAINLIGLSAVLGRRSFRFKVGDATIDATGGGAERLLDKMEGEQ